MPRFVFYLAVLPLVGCAFANVTVTPPRSPINSGVGGGRGREIVIQVPFADDRPQRSRCGMQKNGYNMDTANVNCSAEPYLFVAELLEKELKEAGFSVSYKAQTRDPLRVEGKLLQFFVEPKVGFLTFTPEADIHVRLSATSGSGLVAERDFYVKAEEESLVGTEGNFQLAAEAATKRAIKDMVSAIVSLCDRFPELGQPAPSASQPSVERSKESQS
jgi:Uncharacterized lipoprotein